jgi:glutamyl-tRNA synthetase
MTRPVVTRFAPSPTGNLHIGSARTALFNSLYARRHGGRFLLRVEDTDRERSTEASVQAIFDGLDWMGLRADEPPVLQHARADRHREVAAELLRTGRAYRDHQPPVELETERAAAKAEGRTYRSPWRDRNDPGDDAGPHIFRFKGPIEGDTVVDDLVQGPVRFQNALLDDLVLLRTDGAPTYNLAVVVDDHDMGVTHVIRGDDHLNNAARQSLIYDALGWERPAFAHVPLIHGPDGAKLSKRHGAQAVGDLRQLGYLPEAVRNYLARLGWSHGDNEIFSDEQAADWFDIADVNRGAARLDWDKLNHVNAHYLRQADNKRLAGLVAEVLAAQGELADEQRLCGAMAHVKDRAKTVLDLSETDSPRRRPCPAERRRALTDETATASGGLHLPGAEPAWASRAQRAVKGFAEPRAWPGQIGPPFAGVPSGGAPPRRPRQDARALGRKRAWAASKTPFRAASEPC